MKNLNDITVVIVTYKTPEKIIFDCLKSLDPKVKVIIIENSTNFIHEKNIISDFPNTKIVCTGDNLGYGKGNNFGLKLVKTNFALILNPDVACNKDFFVNLEDIISETEDFTIIGCQYINDKIFMPAGFFDKNKNAEFKKNFFNSNVEPLSKVEWVTGCSLLINLNKFQTREIFDKKFFLYFEEIDLCKSIINKGENIFTSQKLKIHHLGFKSSIGENKINLDELREWHWMWSSFYFYKKNYSYIFALIKLSGKFLRALCKIIFYSIIFKKNLKKKYLYRFLGLINSIMGRPSDFRG